jgi:uncharacterized protein
MNQEQIIKIAEEFARQKMKGFDSGHDWWHVERVRKVARYINEQEAMADPLILEIAVLLHDTVDSKFRNKDIDQAYRDIDELMEKTGLNDNKDQIKEVIRNVSFSNKNPAGNLKDPVLLVLQDADRIDAIGAIGIARAFNYGGFRNNSIYNPGEQPESNSGSTIGHFYDKLLRLKDMMNTVTGRKIAEERHLFMERFLEQFYYEWGFGKQSITGL